LQRLLKVAFLAAAVAGLILYAWHERGRESFLSTSGYEKSADLNWANPASLADHFARHGAEFGARNPAEYARMATQFLQRAKSEGFPAKVDDFGVLRVFEPRTGAFGAYNRHGLTKTFFRPVTAAYFARQPGQSIDLRRRR
jgi:pyocin large subunit-like protein